MEDKKVALKELLLLDWEKLQELAPKPFKPSSLDVILALQAPQLYSQEDSAAIKKFCEWQEQELQLDIAAMNNADKETGDDDDKKMKKMAVNKAKRPLQSEDLDVPMKRRKVTKKPAPKIIKKTTKKGASKTKKPASKAAKKVTKKASQSSNTPPPELPTAFKNKIIELNGTDIMFILRKKVTATDLSVGHDRLSLPPSKLECDFLTEAEIAALNIKEDERYVGIDVILYDSNLKEHKLKLKKWKMNPFTYNLTSPWNVIASDNNLQEEQKLHIWTFKVQDQRYFMFHRI